MSDLNPRQLAEMHRLAGGGSSDDDRWLAAVLSGPTDRTALRPPTLARALDRMLDRIEGKEQ